MWPIASEPHNYSIYIASFIIGRMYIIGYFRQCSITTTILIIVVQALQLVNMAVLGQTVLQSKRTTSLNIFKYTASKVNKTSTQNGYCVLLFVLDVEIPFFTLESSGNACGYFKI